MSPDNRRLSDNARGKSDRPARRHTAYISGTEHKRGLAACKTLVLSKKKTAGGVGGPRDVISLSLARARERQHVGSMHLVSATQP